MKRWREEWWCWRQRKTQQRVKRLLGLIFLILGLGVMGRVYWGFKTNAWEERSRFNLLLIDEKFLFVSFNPWEKRVDLLLLPSEVYIETVGGYGVYQAKKVLKLGELEGKGKELLRMSIQKELALPVDGWVSFTTPLPSSVSDFKRFFLRLFGKSFVLGQESNLNRWQFFRLGWAVLRIKSHRIKLIDLKKTTAWEEFKLPDGSSAYRLNHQKLDLITTGLFIDYSLRNEDLTVAVFNASFQPGRASHAARLIENIGGRVVEVKKTESSKEKFKRDGSSCEVRGDEALKRSYTLKKITSIWGCRYQETKEKARADLTLIFFGEE